MPTEQGGFAQPSNVPETNLDSVKSEQPTFGMKLVGISFNPSGDAKVNRAKELCAQLADLIYDNRKGQNATDLYDELYHHTVGEILNAQMNVVKLLTLKY